MKRMVSARRGAMSSSAEVNGDTTPCGMVVILTGLLRLSKAHRATTWLETGEEVSSSAKDVLARVSYAGHWRPPMTLRQQKPSASYCSAQRSMARLAR